MLLDMSGIRARFRTDREQLPRVSSFSLASISGAFFVSAHSPQSASSPGTPATNENLPPPQSLLSLVCGLRKLLLQLHLSLAETLCSRDGHAMLNSVNKSALQIKKPSHRKSSSPLNWFPRKKTDSFLERKIKLLQQVGGMNSTLDETLGDTNRHYSKVEREKIAARVAARVAMEARKAAMVEASWCRILKAARIQSKDAELQLEKAEKNVEEAFSAASAMGVIMYDRPGGPKRPSKIETLETITGGRSTHTVTASFQTAFEVDKEVAAAVKMAFIRLANCPTWNQDEEFGASRDLLHKISQNPDDTYEILQQENDRCLSSECESETGSESEIETEAVAANFGCDDASSIKARGGGRCKNRHSSSKLVDMMLDRIKLLQEDELASLATIVATCGLNALLLVENNKQNSSESSYPNNMTSLESGKFAERHSKVAAAHYQIGQAKSKQAVTELPSLENFLVKHVSKLEREMQEAKNTRNTVDQIEEIGGMKNGSSSANSNKNVILSEGFQDLGSILIKHASRFEKEIQDAKKTEKSLEQLDKENISVTNKLLSSSILDEVNKPMSRLERAKLEALEENSLDKILVKRVNRLEREKMQTLSSTGRDNVMIPRDQKKEQRTKGTDFESLDKVLVKHVSKLEKEKKMAAACSTWEGVKVRSKQHLEKSGQSLDEILVKPPLSKQEEEKMVAAFQNNAGSGGGSEGSSSAGMGSSLQVRREREMQEAWGGLSLGNSLRPHLSKLERDKAAWCRAEEEERRQSKGNLREDCIDQL